MPSYATCHVLQSRKTVLLQRARSMEFENDIFISYAHLDNEPLGTQEGWISSFHKWLEVRLGQLRGTKPKIWRDPKLQGNDFFADRIVEQFSTVATILPILSPRYIRSEWCCRELQAFVDTSGETGGLSIADKGRIFKIVKTPVPFDQHPQAIQGLLGYDFFTLDPETERVREFNHLSDPALERQYWAKLDDLAQDICELLDLVEKASPQTQGTGPQDAGPASAALTAEQEIIYLADTTYDLKDERDAIRRDLSQQGYGTLPDRSLPLVAPELTEMVGENLSRCRMSIHLLGPNYGIVPEGSTRSVVALQHDLAMAAAETSGLPLLIWMPPDLEIDDDRQQMLLDEVQGLAQSGTDILRTNLEEFKETVYRRLRKPAEEEPAAGEEDGNGDDLTRIYLICDQRDLEDLIPLADFLYDQGFETILPVFEGEPAQIRADHQDSLRLCDAVVIYYGQVNELWLRAKLRELQKIAGYGRQEPMRAKAVYVGGPATPQKKLFRTREATVIKAMDGFEPSLLTDFLSKLP